MKFYKTVDTLANRCYTCINKLRNTKKNKPKGNDEHEIYQRIRGI